MALDTYANLQTSVLSWINRAGDAGAVARCPDFIALAEDELRMNLKRLKVRQGETIDEAFTVDSKYEDLPSGFIGLRSISLNTDPSASLEWISPTLADKSPYANQTGQPRYYTIQNNKFRFLPAPDGAYTATVTYYAMPSLSATITSNWLLAAHPKVYLNQAIAEAYNWLDNIEKYTARTADTARMLDLIYQSDGSDQVGTNMRIRKNGSTP